MKSKSVLITRTSKGIGLESTLVFGRAGFNVFATMRNPDKRPELGQIAKKEALPISISVMDVNSDESVKKSIDAILKSNGPIDVLITMPV